MSLIEDVRSILHLYDSLQTERSRLNSLLIILRGRSFDSKFLHLNQFDPNVGEEGQSTELYSVTSSTLLNNLQDTLQDYRDELFVRQQALLQEIKNIGQKTHGTDPSETENNGSSDAERTDP